MKITKKDKEFLENLIFNFIKSEIKKAKKKSLQEVYDKKLYVKHCKVLLK